jgi:hypothetical protein
MHQKTTLAIQHVFDHPGKSLLRMVDALERGVPGTAYLMFEVQVWCPRNSMVSPELARNSRL